MRERVGESGKERERERASDGERVLGALGIVAGYSQEALQLLCFVDAVASGTVLIVQKLQLLRLLLGVHHTTSTTKVCCTDWGKRTTGRCRRRSYIGRA